jgi:hypothetical protein
MADRHDETSRKADASTSLNNKAVLRPSTAGNPNTSNPDSSPFLVFERHHV